jgi:hypothetical protein
MKKLQLHFATTLALIGSAVALPAGQPISVSVHYNGVDGQGIDNAQADSLLVGDQAGAPGFAQTNWNNLDRWGDVTSGIMDYTGANSGLHVMWDSPWCATSGAASLGTPDGKLMDGMNETDYGGGPIPGDVTGASVYAAQGSQKPLVFVGGIQAWLAAEGQGSTSYSVVLYVQGWHGWYGTSEHWIQSVASGNPSWWNMVPGPELTPHMFCIDTGKFNGTYTQVASTCTSLANASSGGNYIVFNGLTNDEILLVNGQADNGWQSGKLFGFQVVATPPTPITSAPTVSLNPAYALSPVTLTEVASSYSPMAYQWQTDGGSGGSLTNIPDATNSTVVVAPPDIGSSYSMNFDCVVTNTYGTVTSMVAVLNVKAASAPLLTSDTTPLKGDTTPLSIYAFAGGTVNLAAAFNGTQPITNQWQANTGSGFTNIGPATTTNMNLVLTNLQLSESGSYQLVATNVKGHLSSSPATLTVLADPPAFTPSQDAYAYDVLSKSPVAYWPLNEAVDPTTATYQAYDASGHGLEAIYGAGVTTGNTGPEAWQFVGFEDVNNAAGFSQNTANGTVVVPPLNLTSANVTMTAWIYPTANSPAHGGLLVNRGAADAAGLNFGTNVDTNTSSITYGQAELGYVWNNSSGSLNYNSGLFPPLYYWSFVALTITPTNASLYLCYPYGATTNVFKMVNNAANSLETFGSATTTWLGGDPSGLGSIFTGDIGEVAVFGSALSDAQVLNLYFTAQGGGVAPTISQQPVSVAGSSSISTFAGQTVTLTAYGLGYPTPGYQWQRGSGGVFHNITNDSHITGANSSTLTIKTTVADAMEYQLVLTNSYGTNISSVATVNLAPIPLNGIWTVNFAVVGGNNGAPSTAYSGPGVLGNGTFWNALTGGQFANTTTFCDDGITSSGINFQATNYPGSWFMGYPEHNGLLDPYVNTPTAFVFTNVPNGIYSLVVYGISGTYLDDSRGTEFTVNGVSENNVFQQDYFFAPGDNTALFDSVVVSNGGLVINEAPIGLQADGVTPNTEPDFNGAQLQAVSLDPVTITPVLSAGNLTLSWANYGTLMSATNIAGPWAPVSGAVSPIQVNPTNAAKFFRVQIH